MKSTPWNAFIYFIFFVKILFILFAGTALYFEVENDSKNPWSTWAIYWKNRTEFIFIASMSLICLILFNPFSKGPLVLDHDVRLLLFVYGIMILITSNWKTFFGAVPQWLLHFQKLL